MIQRRFGCAWSGYAARCGVLLLASVAVGCGARQANVSGRVFLDAAPLPGGRVTFRPAEPRHNSVSAELDEQGNYQATLPLGEVMVCVDNRELEPPAAFGGGVPPGLPASVKKALADKSPAKAAAPPAKQASGRYVEIPEKYYTFETSGLQFTVERDGQKQDIKLTK